MLFDPSSPLTEKQWEKLKMAALTTAVVGVVRAACGVAKDIATEAVRRRLGWADEPDEDDDVDDGDS
jgi:hypothetical protein